VGLFNNVHLMKIEEIKEKKRKKISENQNRAINL
jgi:hypothetical protein